MKVILTDEFLKSWKTITRWWNRSFQVGGFSFSVDIYWMFKQIVYKIKHHCFPSEVYDLYDFGGEYLLPRLERFLEIIKDPKKVSGTPNILINADNPFHPTKEESEEGHARWVNILEKIIWALKAESDDEFDRKYKPSDLEMNVDEQSGEVTFTHKISLDKYHEEDIRREELIQEGFELLGKYWRSLWI